ncbi:MAG: hypothetical protein AAGF68_00680 [Pseudomonadota bacterium]
MLPIPATRHQEAVRFMALHGAFELPKNEHPRDSETAAKQGLCEALSYVHGASFSLGEVFSLSDRLMAYRDTICDGGEPAIYDVRALAEHVGSYDLALVACKLCGAWIDGDQWRDDGVGHPIFLTFEDWTNDE